MAFIAATALLLAPARPKEVAKVDFTAVKQVIDTRCVACHADKPSFQGFAEAPKGVKLDSAARIRAQRVLIHQQTVLAKAMPPGNLTAITEEERMLLDRWFRAGDR